MQSQLYNAEVSRRAWFGWLARDAAGDIGSIAGGLRYSTDMQVTAPVSGMNVLVGSGEAYVSGSSSPIQGGYYARISSSTSLSVAAASGSNPRVDLVCVTVEDSAYVGSNNDVICQVITGTPTSGTNVTPGSGGYLAGAPSVPTSSLALAYVLVPQSSTSVVTANILNVAVQVSSALVPSNLACRVYMGSGAAPTANGSPVKVPLNAVSYNQGGHFDAVLNYRYTVAVAGLYLVVGAVQMDWTAVPQGFASFVYRNGVQVSQGGQWTLRDTPDNVGDAWVGQVADTVLCSVGDYLELWCVNSVATSASPTVGLQNTYMSVARVG